MSACNQPSEEFQKIRKVHELLKKASWIHIYQNLYSEAINLYDEVLSLIENEPSAYELSENDIIIIKYAICSCYLNKKAEQNKALEIIQSITCFGDVFPAIYYIHAKLLFAESYYHEALDIINVGMSKADKMQNQGEVKWPGTTIPILESNLELLYLKFEALQQQCYKAVRNSDMFEVLMESKFPTKEDVKVQLVEYKSAQDFFSNDNEKQPRESYAPKDGTQSNCFESIKRSSNNSLSNLKIDAPEFIPTELKKKRPTKEDEMSVKSENASSTTNSDIYKTCNKEFEDKVTAMLHDLKIRIKTGFLNVGQKQMDLLFRTEDRINGLQKHFMMEIAKENMRADEERDKRLDLEGRMQQMSELLTCIKNEKEEEAKKNLALKSYIEKQCQAIYDFQKYILHELEEKCNYIKAKMNQIAPFVNSCSIPTYEDFHQNFNVWSKYEIQLKKYAASLDMYRASTLKNIQEGNFMETIFPTDFPIGEPKCILNEVFMHLLHSYNSLHVQKNTSQSYTQQLQSTMMPQLQYRYSGHFTPSHHLPPAQPGVPVYYTRQAPPQLTPFQSNIPWHHSSSSVPNTNVPLQPKSQQPVIGDCVVKKAECLKPNTESSKIDISFDPSNKLSQGIEKINVNEDKAMGDVKNNRYLENTNKDIPKISPELKKKKPESTQLDKGIEMFMNLNKNEVGQTSEIETILSEGVINSEDQFTSYNTSNVGKLVDICDDNADVNVSSKIEDNTSSFLLKEPVSISSNDQEFYSSHSMVDVQVLNLSSDSIQISSNNVTNTSKTEQKDSSSAQTSQNFLPPTYFESQTSSSNTVDGNGKSVQKFYDSTLSFEERLENLSSEVKAAGGPKFWHLFLYLWENIPNVSEEDLLKAIQMVKKTVGKLSGMRKESILISVKRKLEKGLVEENLATDPSKLCTICYEEFRTGKVHQLQCGHTFHASCIGKWLLNNNVCPICRFYIIIGIEDEKPS